MTSSHFSKVISLPSERHGNVLAIAIIFLYCISFATLRLYISPTMDLDDAEQFVFSTAAYSWGYSNQPPLYTWVVKAISSIIGMNIKVLMAVKYSMMFCFYYSFYRLCCSFWDTRQSLLITGSLLLFYTYSYDFNRHLSHTILVTALSSLTSLIYVYLLRTRKTLHYFLIGAAISFGILTKYNFLFFLFGLILASISTKEGRRVLFDRRVLVSLFICCFIISPHIAWLIHQKFQTVHHALVKAHAGEVPIYSLQNLLIVIGASFYGIITFPLLFIIFFRRYFLPRATNISGNSEIISPFRWIVLYGLLVPLCVIIVFRTGHFSEKWLAPLLFCIPLALFSRVDIDMNKKRFQVFGYICIVVAVMMFLLRAFIGFCLPDVLGRVERVHTPFRAVSRQLVKELRNRGIITLHDLTIIADSNFLVANIEANIPAAEFMVLKQDTQDKLSRKRNVVFVWDASELGIQIPKHYSYMFPDAIPIGIFDSPYIHSKKLPPYRLGAALIPSSK
jgi:4-amino-4-deoxy-L-arabinose transferase-like glycosyltransferase